MVDSYSLILDIQRPDSHQGHIKEKHRSPIMCLKAGVTLHVTCYFMFKHDIGKDEAESTLVWEPHQQRLKSISGDSATTVSPPRPS